MPEAALPQDAAGWREFFARFPDIVLVANSDAVSMSSLTAQFGPDALFVFFNKVYKVLDRPFEGNSVLVARSSEMGANIVYRREVDDVVRLLRQPGFRGLLNLSAAESEVFSTREAFLGHRVGFLDLSAYFSEFYPAGHLPSSGFALAVWLVEQGLPGRVHLAGFTAQRSAEWKLFHVHDWTFEQVVQRVLVRSGRLNAVGQKSESPYEAVAARLPGITAGQLALASIEIASERIEASNREIDRLISLTRLNRGIENLIRRLKPKTRKRKLKEMRDKETGSYGV